jgi:hypothetical protein
MVALAAGLVLAPALPAHADDRVLPTPVDLPAGPTPLVRTDDGQWAFQIRLADVTSGYIATWEHRSATWADPDAARAEAEAQYACQAGIDDAFFAQYPSLDAFLTSPEVTVDGDSLFIRSAPLEAWRQRYDQCSAPSAWDWSRTGSRTDGDVEVVTIPLSVLGPGRHDLFVLGVWKEAVSATHDWPDGWLQYTTHRAATGPPVRFTVYVPRPTTRGTGATLRAPAVPPGSWFAQSSWSSLPALPFGRAEPAAALRRTGASADGAATADTTATHVRAAAVRTWLDPRLPAGLARTAITGVGFALLVGAGALLGRRRQPGGSTPPDESEPGSAATTETGPGPTAPIEGDDD